MTTPNITPNYTRQANVSSCLVTAANTNSQGTCTAIGTDVFKAFTAGVNDSYVDYVRFIPTATVAATPTVATTARIFLSSKTSGATTGSGANPDTRLIAEVALPVVTADHSTAPVNPIDVPLKIRVPAGMTLLVTNHIAPAANTAWNVVVPGNDY